MAEKPHKSAIISRSEKMVAMAQEKIKKINSELSVELHPVQAVSGTVETSRQREKRKKKMVARWLDFQMEVPKPHGNARHKGNN